MTRNNSNDDTELKDGIVARVPLMMMDSRTVVLDDGLPTGLHKPGYRYTATDAVAETRKQMARDSYEDELVNAHRKPAPTVDELLSACRDATVDDAPAATREEAYAEYDRRIADAWKGN